MAISVNCVYASVPFEKVPQKLLARSFRRSLSSLSPGGLLVSP